MGVVNVADQYNADNILLHRIHHYFRKRVYEANLFQSLTKSWLVLEY